MKHIALLFIAFALLTEVPAQEVKRDVPYAAPAHERRCLMFIHLLMPKTCPLCSGFTAAVGRPATNRAYRRSRLSRTKDLSLSQPITDYCRTLTCAILH